MKILSWAIFLEYNILFAPMRTRCPHNCDDVLPIFCPGMESLHDNISLLLLLYEQHHGENVLDLILKPPGL